jgi:hypothetical protein
VARHISLAATFLCLSACVPWFPQPLTAVDLEQYNSGAALVAYLAQPAADPTVCDMGSQGPHIRKLWAEDSEALVDGLVDGRVAKSVWRACTSALLRSAPSAVMPAFLNAAGRGYRKLITREGFERDYEAQTRLIELQAIYLNRARALQPEAAVAGKLFEELREALSKGYLGSYASKLATQLLAAYDLEHGRWKGRALDLATLDALFSAHDSAALQLIFARSSSEQLRSEAKRRIIRLHIAASTFPEVKANAAEVEETLMRLGNNPQDLAVHRVVSGGLDKLPWQSVSVQQNFAQQTASLIGRGPVYDGASVLPLRAALHVTLQGVSRPVTLCAEPSALDPTPCMVAEQVSLGHPLVRIHADQLALRTGMPIAETMELCALRQRRWRVVDLSGRCSLRRSRAGAARRHRLPRQRAVEFRGFRRSRAAGRVRTGCRHRALQARKPRGTGSTWQARQ